VIQIVSLFANIIMPLLISYMIVNVSGPVWGVDLTNPGARNAFQIHLLNFADSLNYAVMPLLPAGFVFFQSNPLWFFFVRGSFIIAWTAILYMIAMQAGYIRIYRRLGDVRSTSLARPSLFLIDLPFVLVRLYYIHVRIEISYIFLAKNFTCLVNNAAILIMGSSVNPVSEKIASVVSMLPGAHSVSAKGHADFLKKTEMTLAEQEQAIERNKQELEVKHQQVDSLKTIMTLLNGQLSDDPGKFQKVSSAFEYLSLDEDGDGKFSREELNHIFMQLAMPESIAQNILEEFSESQTEEQMEFQAFVQLFVSKCEGRL
jgi:hypothetical protein